MSKKPTVIGRLKAAIMPKPLPALLDQHDALSTRLDALDRQHAAESQALQQAQADLRTARDAEARATEAARNRSCYGLDPEQESECARRIAEVADVQAARLSLRRAQARVDEIEEKLKAVADERDTAALERFGLKNAASPETLVDLLALQDRLTVERTEIASLAARLDALNAAPVEPLPDLTATDTALAAALVKVELGEAEPDILPALEQQRASAHQAHERMQAEQARADLLRQGLAARLATAKAEAERLEIGRKLALSWHLEAELDRTASDYRETAERLFDLRGRLIGLSRVLQFRVDHDAGRRIGVERPTHDDALGARLIVPDASLPALAGMDAMQDTRRFRDAAYATELERLRQAGIEV